MASKKRQICLMTVVALQRSLQHHSGRLRERRIISSVPVFSYP